MEISIETKEREKLVDITEKVKENIPSGKGIVHVFTPHATAGVTINENDDPELPKDISEMLHSLAPQGKWKHDRIDGNADAHIKTSLIGNSVSVPFENGKILLGTWQNIFLCEFDGPRRDRKIILSFVKGE